jgi:hypothetical protein
VTRREALRVGGLSLFSGVSLPTLLHAAGQQGHRGGGGSLDGQAKSVILINLFGGPPHQDTFDLKPQAPSNIRGEFQPISSRIPGLHVCELLPRTAAMMDRLTLIRTYSHKYNSHNPYNVLTGFDGGSDRENYFAKKSDHPSMMSVARHFGLGRDDIPPYVIMPSFPGFSQGLRRAGPYGGYLGTSYDPLFTVWDKKFGGKGEFYKPVPALGEPLLPSLEELPAVTANRHDRRLGRQRGCQAERLGRQRHADGWIGRRHAQRGVEVDSQGCRDCSDSRRWGFLQRELSPGLDSTGFRHGPHAGAYATTFLDVGEPPPHPTQRSGNSASTSTGRTTS